MSRDDLVRWDMQHAASHGTEPPSSFLRNIVESSAWQLTSGRALDIACGKGRNALYLAERGMEVDAIDISAIALEEGRKRAAAEHLRINWQQGDLEQTRLPDAGYDVILDFNYLQRSLISRIHQAVKIDGYIIFETYLIDQRTIGHPKNPDYLLQHNELLELFRGFRVLFYHEGKFDEANGVSFRAGLFAQKIC